MSASFAYCQPTLANLESMSGIQVMQVLTGWEICARRVTDESPTPSTRRQAAQLL